jgi:HEAT repeat protein
VRATALTALARLGRATAADVAALLSDASPVARRRACEVGAGVAGVDLVAVLGDPEPSVVEAAAWALGERAAATEGAVIALADVARGHIDASCREAAVAALGALGDPAGLPAVLAALSDKPAVRRRAVVALAAFEGPEVDDALRRALQDRDWQVRQVAEDLLVQDGERR